jgi:phosphate transport system substrate-binding protein
LEKGIESTPYSLGATGISSAHRRKVKILKLNDKEPNFENIRTGQYLMYRPLYLVSQGANADPLVKDFVTFAISREGQDVIRKTGTVPYTDSLGLVMKQIEEYDVANNKGLFSTATEQELKKKK